jgi:MYXO-CTERM domain-containing protein
MILRGIVVHPEACVLLSLLSLLCPSASAFAPTDAVWIGEEPNRTFRTHAATQARLRHQPGWEAFLDGEGAGWQARFDERTGTAHRAWGAGLDLGPVDDPKSVEAGLRAFFARNPHLLAVPLSDLRLRNAAYVARTDTWYVDFDRLVHGVPVWRGGVTARLRVGKLVLFGADTYPAVTDLPVAKLDADAAIRIAELDGPASMADHRDDRAALTLLPMEIDGAIDLRLVWEVHSTTTTPIGKWVSHVDARTGELLDVYNEVRFLDGTLNATHDTRTVNGDYTTSGVPLAYLTGDDSGTSVTTGMGGTFTIDPQEAWSTALRGSYVSVKNDAGRNGALSFTDGAPTWTDADATQAEIDTYMFVHDVRAWGLDIAPEVAMSTDALRANVNLDETCNAYYDGNVNFYEAGDGCNNTGRIADVVYHEWGHGFHYYSAVSGTVDGSLGEGAGDTTAMLQTLDPEIGPYFLTNGDGIRELETNYVYPDDITGEVHQDGLIFAGSVWDLFGELASTYGETRDEKGEAWRVTATLFAGALKGGPTIEESYDEFVVADDDDGDLSNGTPHQCEIIDAFGQHGLGPGGGDGSLLSLAHEALGNQPADTAIPVTGDIVNLSPACVSFSVGTVDFVYSIDDGAHWDTVELSVAGDTFAGDLPGFSAGTVVEYYLTAQADDGSTVSLPSGGDIAPYTFYVGVLEELYCEAFDDGDGGYSHELLDGNDQRGADDWIFGTPAGYADDPDAAYTGRKVWGNDLGGGDYNGEYQSSIVNRLSSPPIDVTGESQVVVQYRRWLNVEDGVYDHASVYANDEEAWTNHASTARIGDEHTQDTDWVLHTLVVSPGADTLTLGWEIDSDEGLEFGGWNIDDVCVYRIAEPLTVFGIDDFVATDDLASSVGLSWTQPDDARATDAIVVRRDDRFPADRDDGDIVFTGSDLPPGEVVETTDTSGGGYYAVFAGGSAGWLTGAVEGDNADEGYPLDGGPAGDGDGDGVLLHGDCGCASGPTGSSGSGPLGVALAGAAGVVAVLRRRTR